MDCLFGVALRERRLIGGMLDPLVVTEDIRAVHVVAVEQAVVVIETLAQGTVFMRASQMPFADAGAGVTQRFEGVGDGGFIGGHAASVAGKEDLNDAGSDGVAAGQQGRTGGGADGVGAIELRHLNALARHAVHVGGMDGRVAAPVPVAVSHIVGEEDHEIGLFAGRSTSLFLCLSCGASACSECSHPAAHVFKKTPSA